MKKFLLSLATLVLIIFVFLWNYASSEQSNHYKNIQDAKADSAIERGWIPSIVPESAFDIVETHNLDNNVVYGSFYYKEKDEASFMKQLVLISGSENTYKWEDIFFHVDKKLHKVWYRNKTDN